MGVMLKEWEYPKVFKFLQKHGRISDVEMRTVFNCGYGMLLFTDEKIEKMSNWHYLGKVTRRQPNEEQVVFCE